MEQKENKTGAIIGTVAAIVLCGLPGLCLLCPLSVWMFTGSFPDLTGSNYYTPAAWGVLPLCLSVVFIAIAVLVPVLTLRKKKVAAELPPSDPMPPQEPLPPVS
jgi:Na+/melibiose symporter-like transporter